MSRLARIEPTTAIIGVGLALTGLSVFGVVAFAERGSYETWLAILVGPVLFAVSIPALARQAARESDRTVFWLLLLALTAKLVGAIMRNYIELGVYGGKADSAAYYRDGLEIAERFRHGVFDTGLHTLIGTNFIRFSTGVLYTVLGPSELAGFIVYSWLSFWGLFLFSRAFTIALPEGRARTYACLVFFLPSLLIWPSAIGNDAWWVVALGLASFGVARLISGTTVSGIVWAISGMWLAALVRPHIAGMVCLGLVAAFILRRPKEKLRQLAPVAKVLGLAVFVVVSVVLVMRADEYLRGAGIETDAGLTTVLTQTAERTSRGGSEFAPSVLTSPARAPVAVLTVLFRPLITEAGSVQSAAAALETTFLLVLSIFRFGWFVSALRNLRRRPYLAYALVYCVLFIVAFSSIANLGIVVRERVQLLPFFLVFLSVPPSAFDPRPTAEQEQAMEART